MSTNDDAANSHPSPAAAPSPAPPAEPARRAETNEHADWSDGDLGDLHQELRILLPGTQTLTAFLIILPFNNGFAQIQAGEQYVYLATFLCSITALILFTAPAAQHRLQRPLRDREQFKNNATRLIIIGLVPLSAALVLATQLVIAQVLAHQLWPSLVAAGLVASLIVAVWWHHPLRGQADQRR